MRLLVTGSGESGSWQVRGVQLGRAVGATVCKDASTATIRAHDLVVLVKRPTPRLLDRLHGAEARIVWDVVDAWPQPEGNAWPETQALAWLHGQVETIRPLAVVAATQRMADDLKPVVSNVLALPHHARPGLRPQPLRPTVSRLGYEGSRKQLGRWRDVLERECARRGWRFVMNPKSLGDVDIVTALRDADGYPPRHWKSNVKLANAQASGVPIVCNRECGYLETASGGERWADDEHELAAALDSLASLPARTDAAAKLVATAPTLDGMARRYLAWLQTLIPPQAARETDWMYRLRRMRAHMLKF